MLALVSLNLPTAALARYGDNDPWAVVLYAAVVSATGIMLLIVVSIAAVVVASRRDVDRPICILRAQRIRDPCAIVAADTVAPDELRETFVTAFADYLIGPFKVGRDEWPGFLTRQGVDLHMSRVAMDPCGPLAFALVAPRPRMAAGDWQRWARSRRLEAAVSRLSCWTN